MVTFKGEKSPCCGALFHWDPDDEGGWENPWCDECTGDVHPHDSPRPAKVGGAS